MKRKMKRFNDGGISEEDSNQGNPTKSESYTAEADSFVGPKQTFKQAFAAARKAGDKTFKWRGTKYTTELASEKPKAPKSTPATDESAAETVRLRSAADKARRADIEAVDKPLETINPETYFIGGPSLKAVQRAAQAVARGGKAAKTVDRIEPYLGELKDINPRRGVAETVKRIGSDRPRLAAPARQLPPPEGMKKGGKVSTASKRADGCAVRGETKGRIY